MLTFISLSTLPFPEGYLVWSGPFAYAFPKTFQLQVRTHIPLQILYMFARTLDKADVALIDLLLGTDGAWHDFPALWTV